MAVDERRLLDAWFSNRKALKKALTAVGLSFDDLSRAPQARRAIAAALSWHCSTSGGDAVRSEVAERLVEAVQDHVEQHGWVGAVGLCDSGDHFSVGNDLLRWEPVGCHDAIHLYWLGNLEEMADAVT